MKTRSFSLLTSRGDESVVDSNLGTGSSKEIGSHCETFCEHCRSVLDKSLDTSVERSDINLDKSRSNVDTPVCLCSSQECCQNLNQTRKDFESQNQGLYLRKMSRIMFKLIGYHRVL